MFLWSAGGPDICDVWVAKPQDDFINTSDLETFFVAGDSFGKCHPALSAPTQASCVGHPPLGILWEYVLVYLAFLLFGVVTIDKTAAE